MMHHEPRRVSDTLYRCSCGSDFRTMDDAEVHAENANAEARERVRPRPQMTERQLRKGWALPRGWTVELREGGQWELMEGTAHRGLYDSRDAAVAAARDLTTT